MPNFGLNVNAWSSGDPLAVQVISALGEARDVQHVLLLVTEDHLC